MPITEQDLDGLLGPAEEPAAGPAGGGFTEADLDAILPPEDAAAPAAPPSWVGRATNKAAHLVEDYEQQQDDAVRLIFRNNGTNPPPERMAEVVRLQKETGADSDVIKKNFDSFQKEAELARSNPREWRKKNPDLAALALRSGPDVASLVTQDQQLSLWAQANNALVDWGHTVDKAWEPIGSRLMPSQYTPEAKAARDAELEAHRTLPKQETLVRDQKSQVIEDMGFGGAAIVPIIRFGEASMQMDLSKLGKDLMQARMAASLGKTQAAAKPPEPLFVDGMEVPFGNAPATSEPLLGDPNEIESRILDLRNKAVRRDYNEGPVSRTLSSVASAMASQWAVSKDAGVAAGVGGLLGGAAGAVVTENPATALSWAAKTASLFGKVGMAKASYDLESGGFYLDTEGMKTDDGRPIPEEERWGGSAAYGMLAAAVEVASTGELLKAMGPVGNMVRKGEAKAFFAALMKDSTTREILRRVGKSLAHGALSEGGEEGVQEGLKQLFSYLTVSAAQGSSSQQKFWDPESIWQSSEQGALGGLGMAGPMAVINLSTQMIARDNSLLAGRQVADLAKLHDSPTVRAAPEEVADMVRRATAKAGAPIKNLFVDPEAFTKLFQSSGADAVAAATELLGPEGPRILQEAVATGQLMEVPLQTYLEKWGGKDVAKALVEHTTTSQKNTTTAVETAADEATKARAKEIVAQYEGENAPAAPASEQAYADELEAQLIKTKRAGTAEEARKVVMLHRAFIRATAERFGQNPDALFAQYAVQVRRGEDPMAVIRTESADQTTLSQPPLGEDTVDPISARAQDVDTATRASDLFTDDVSGLRNKAAWDALPRRADKPMVAVITTTDAKAINDEPTGGHDTTNALLRSIGANVGALDSEAARHGTNFLLHVKDQAELDSHLKELRSKLPDASLRLEGGAGATLDDAFKATDATVDKQRKAGTISPRGFTAFDLKQLPALEETLAKTKPFKGEVPQSLVDAAQALAPEDFHREAYLSKLFPWMLNRLGFQAAGEKAFVASLDVVGLKDINGRFGKTGGDQVLAHVARVARDMGGSAVTLAHFSGDEFAAKHGNKAELEGFVEDLNAELQAKRAHVKFDGRTYPVEVRLRSGIGEKTYGAADRALNTAKRAERDGTAGTGDQPGGLPRAGGLEAGSRPAGAPLSDAQRSAVLAERRARADRRSVQAEDPVYRQRAPAEHGDGGGAGRELADDVSFDVAELEAALEEAPPLHTPEKIEGKRAEIARMRKPEKKAMAEAWLDYTLGLSKERPQVTPAMEKLFARDGFVDPLNPYSYEEGGRSMERGLGGKRVRGTEPAELKRQRLENAEHAAGGDYTKIKLEQPAFHGSPHRFEKFSLQKLGTGEGAQAYGWGLYFAGKKEIAEHYRRALSGQTPAAKAAWTRLSGAIKAVDSLGYDSAAQAAQALYSDPNWKTAYDLTPEQAAEISAALAEYREQSKGQLFRVEVPEDAELLDYDKPVGGQSEQVKDIAREVLTKLGEEPTDEALSKLSGVHLYEKIQMIRHKAERAEGRKGGMDPKFASEFLLERGVPGLRYLDADSRAEGKGTHNYVIWDDSRVDVQEKFYQPGDEGEGPGPERGSVQFNKAVQEGMKRIFDVALNPNADLSTFLHESGHVFLEMFSDLAARADAPASVKEDYATTLKWLEVEKREDIAREHHEKWARGFEAYLMTGKAPTPQLAGAFQRFRLWLTNIYKNISALNVELNPEISGVFDRLLATDEEIARSKQQMGFQLLTPEAAAAIGIEGQAYQDYLAEAERATATAVKQVDHRALKDRLRATEDWWKAEHKEEVKRAEEAFRLLPVNRAAKYMRTGELIAPDGTSVKGLSVKLDPKQVAYVLGRKAAKSIAQFLKKGGVHPDEVAELFGFPTGRAMLEELETRPEREAWVKREAQQAMEAKHPDVLKERTQLQEAAAKGLHGDHTAKWLIREWEALGKKVAPQGWASSMKHLGTSPVDAVRLAAKEIVEKRTQDRLDAGNALRAERSAADKAAKAIAKGNFEQAYAHKQQQLLNMFLHRFLSEAREARDSFETLAGQLSKDDARARLGKAHQAYLDAVDLILETLQLKDPPAQRDRAIGSIGDAINQMGADGGSVLFNESIVGRVLANPKDWRTLTVLELQEVHSALLNIKAVAGGVLTAILDGKRVDKAVLIEELLTEAATNLPHLGATASSEDAKSGWRNFSDGIASFDADLLRPETMIRWLGGTENLKSAWFRALVIPLQAAKAKEVDLLNRTIKPIIHAFESMPKELKERANEKIDGKALFPNHRDDIEAPTRMFELLAMLLNSGNESNLHRLLEGRSITKEQLVAAFDKHLSPKAIEWAQKVLDGIEALWPESSALEAKLSGLAPPKIIAKEFATKHGTLRGGYYPVIYNTARENVGKLQLGGDVAALMDPSFTRPGTAHGHLKSRAENFSGAIDLRLSAISAHMAQAAHDIAYREAVQSVGGLLMNQQIQGALTDRLGEERTARFLQWVKDVGQMRGASATAHAKGLTKLAMKLKGNTVIGVLGWSARTALGDFANLAAALPGSKFKLKPKHWAAGMAQYFLSPNQTRATVLEKSPEMRTRAAQIQRELVGEINKLTKRGPLATGPLAWFKEHAFTFMEWSDAATSTPIWLGGYRQALAAGEAEADAVVEADALIRKLFPSHSPVDTAAIIRDKGFIGASMMFYGYMNVAYNNRRDIWNDVHITDGAMSKVAAAAKAAAISLAFSATAMVLSEVFSGRGPDDDEEPEEWLLRKMAVSQFQDVPFAGTVAGGVENWWLDKRTNPRASPMVEVANGVGAAILAAQDDSLDGAQKAMKAVRGFGPLIGLPTAAPLRAAEYGYGAATGDIDVEGALDVPSGLIFGK